MSAALQLLRTRRHFRRLWLGNVVSQLGDWVGWVAVAIVALQEGGGPLDLALVFAAHHLPAAALAPVSGVLADRFDRRALLWITSVVLGLITLAMAGAAALGALAVLQFLLLVRSGVFAFFTPAERAALPRVVHREELLMAGALDAATWSVVFSFGMAAGGALSLLGPVLALTIDAATFGLAALLFAGLPKMVPEGGAKQPPKLWRGVPDALRFSWRRPKLRRAVFAKTPYAVAAGAAWMALAIQADAIGGAALGGVGFGVLHAVRGIGTGVGPVVVAQRASRGGDRIRLWRWLYWVGLAGTVGFGFAGGIGALIAAALAWGVGGGANWVVSTEQIQRLTPDHILARTNALDVVGMTVGMTFGVAGVALALDAGVDLGPAVLLFAVPAALAWWVLDRGAHRIAIKSRLGSPARSKTTSNSSRPLRSATPSPGVGQASTD